jgi:pyruvate dehydrogenase E2 component (dihydrolipoamide acetyltransferase)
MVEQIIVPKLGMAAAEVTLTEWRVAEGSRVEKGDPVLDIEAEKTSFEMTAPATGFVHILMKEGEETDVNTIVGLIAESEEEYSALLRDDGQAAPAAAPVQSARQEQAPLAEKTAGAAPLPISPIARKLAAEHNVDIASVAGSGPGGRIQKEDVERAIEAQALSAVRPTDSGKTIRSTIPYKGMRKTIGENMMRSLAVNAPNTMSGEFDLSETVKVRERLVAQEASLGARITYAEILIFAVARALRAFPLMNSSLIEDEIKLWQEVNIGMAVGLGEHGEEGLLVPVIRNADVRSLVDISLSAKDLGQKARAGSLSPDEMSGGTFTVSNFGSVGVSAYSTPIINHPESAILGIGRLTQKPVVKRDEIVIAPMLPYSLTHDHRVTDGAAAEAFLRILKEHVENVGPLLSEIGF